MSDTLRNSGRLSVAVLGSRVLAVARESLFAHLFGAGFLADAYQVAFRIPNLLRDLFAEGAMASAFVPTFTAYLADGDEAGAHRLGRLMVSAVLIATGVVALAGVVFAGPVVDLLSNGFDSEVLSFAEKAEKKALAVSLTRVMMPFLCLVSLAAVFMGMLNARERFMAPAMAPAMFNVVSIVAGVTLLILDPSDERGLWLWSLGTVVGGGAQAIFQVPPLWRLGFRPWPLVRGFFSNPGVRRIGRLMAPAMLGLAAVQLNLVFNTRFASALGHGPVSQYSYAFRLFYLPVGVFGVALATVTTTKVSVEAARGDRKAILAATEEALSAVWMLMVASTVGLAVLAEPVVEVLFERGAFGHKDTLATAAVLQAMVLALVPYGLVKILAPVFYSIDRPRFPLLASATAVAINIGFNALTYRQLGAPGLALGMSLGMAGNYLILRMTLRRALGSMPATHRLRHGVALAVGAALMGAAVTLGRRLLETSVLSSEGRGSLGHFLSLVVLLVLLIPLGFYVYTGILRAFSYPGARALGTMPATVARRVFRRRTASN